MGAHWYHCHHHQCHRYFHCKHRHPVYTRIHHHANSIINISTIYDSNDKSLSFHHIFIKSDWCIHTLFCQLEFRFFFGTPKCTLPTFSVQCTKLQCTNIVHCTTLLNQAASAPSPPFKALLLARHKPSHAVHNTNVQCGGGHWKPGKHYL